MALIGVAALAVTGVPWAATLELDVVEVEELAEEVEAEQATATVVVGVVV